MTTPLAVAFGDVCLRYRKTILTLIAGLTVLAASQLPNAVFDNSMEAWFLRDDPDLVQYRAMTETYGNDEYVVIGLAAPDVFAPEVVAKIHRVTERLRDAPHVEKVFSLTNMESVHGENGMLTVDDLVPADADPAELPTIRRRTLANPLYVGNVVNAAGDFTAVSARVPFRPDDVTFKLDTLEAARRIAEEEWGPDYFLAGGPTMDEELHLMNNRDTAITTGLMTALLLLLLWALLRTPTGVVVPALTVGIATVWAIGWLPLFGRRMTVISQALPPMMLAVGVADSMHILVAYQQACWHGKDKWSALREVYRDLTGPCFLTSLTTCIGMLSLGVSEIKAIRELGLFAALGVFGAFVLSMSLAPILLSYLPPPRPPEATAVRRPRGFRWLEATYRLHRRWAGAVMACALLLCALSVYGVTRIVTTSGLLSYFKDDTLIKQQTREIEARLSGTSTLEILVDTGRPDGLKDPAVLQHMAGLQQFLQRQPTVTATHSVNEVLADLRRAFFDNDPDEYRLPLSREEAAQYIFLYELAEPDGDIYEYVNYDYGQGRVTARLTSESATAMLGVLDATRRYIAQHFPDSLEGIVTGNAVLWGNMDTYMRTSLIRGFSIALVAIFIVLCVQVRSVALGAVAMVPNVGPILFCLGVMGLFGVPLDTTTTMVASITIGLAVDNTVHFLARSREWVDRGVGLETALHRTTHDIGRALLFTSVTLSCAFVAMLFCEFIGMNRFGALCGLTILVALPYDLLVLPVLLRWYARAWRREWMTQTLGAAGTTPAFGIERVE